MPVYTSVKFYDEYTDIGGGGIDFIHASVGDKIKAIINVNIHWESLNVMLLFDTASKTIRRTDYLGSFINDGFKVGDSFTITGTTSNNGSYAIASITDNIITTVGALVLTETTTGNLFGDTLVTGVDFYYNLIKKTDTEHYDSSVDIGTLQKFNAGSLNACGVYPTTLTPATNSKGWVNNSAIITPVSCTSHQQKFTITHIFYITPLFLHDQLTLIQNKTLPQDGSLDDSRAGTYVYRVDAKFNNEDPNIPHTTNIQFREGQVGWYGEKIGEGTPEYSCSAFAFETPTFYPLTCLDYTQQILVVMVIKSMNGHFVDTVGGDMGTPIVLNQIYLPLIDSDFINTATDLDTNFLHDRKLIYLGQPASNGEKFGTPYQQITNAIGFYSDPFTCVVEFIYNAGSSIKSALTAKEINNRNFLISVTPQRKNIFTTSGTDRNVVNCIADNACVDLRDITLFSIPDKVNFFQYPDTTLNAKGDFIGFNTDTVFTSTKFKVKNGKILQNLKIKIEATNDIHSFVLQEKDFDTTSQLDNNNVSQVNDFETNGYNLDPSDLRNQTNLFRDSADDAGGYVFYILQHGFKLRDENWFKVDTATDDFVNNNPEIWSVYSKRAGWRINYNIYASVLDPTTNFITDFVQVCNLRVLDDSDSVNPCTITTNLGATDLEKNLLNDQITTVKASFTSYLPFEVVGNYYGILYLDYNGGLFIDQTTTESDPIISSVWIEKVTITRVSNSLITLVADIDFNKLDKNNTGYVLKARLGHK